MYPRETTTTKFLPKSYWISWILTRMIKCKLLKKSTEDAVEATRPSRRRIQMQLGGEGWLTAHLSIKYGVVEYRHAGPYLIAGY